jgi:hypothetical protein
LVTLREKLQHITDNFSVEQHPLMIQELILSYDHFIKLVHSQYPIDRYTCVVYSFGLTQDPTYLAIAGFGLGRTFAGANFIHFLLDHGLISQRQAGYESVDDLAIYFHNDIFKHVGTVLASNRVRSKWGRGHLFDHPTWNVPLSYGDSVKYFKQLEPKEGLDLFIGYAKFKGFTFNEKIIQSS